MSSGDVAVVSGASRGIGRALSELLLDHGYRVYGLYVASDNEASDLAEKHKQLSMHRVDVGSSEEVSSFFEMLSDKEDRLDLLINNAGIYESGKVEEMSVDSWDRVMATNVSGVFYVTKFAMPMLKKSSNAVIVSLASRVGLEGGSGAEYIAYAASKAAVLSISQGLEDELKQDGIAVCAVVPAVTDTDIFRTTFSEADQEYMIENNKLNSVQETTDLIWKAIEIRQKGVVIDKKVSAS